MTSLNNIGRAVQTRRKALGVGRQDTNPSSDLFQEIEEGADVKLSTLLHALEALNLELTISPKHDAKLSSSSVYSSSFNSSNFKASEASLNRHSKSNNSHEHGINLINTKSSCSSTSYSNHRGVLTQHFNGDTLDFWFGPEAEQ